MKIHPVIKEWIRRKPMGLEFEEVENCIIEKAMTMKDDRNTYEKQREAFDRFFYPEKFEPGMYEEVDKDEY